MTKQKGAASLEAALLFPVLLGLVLMFFEVGRVQWHFSALDHALQKVKRDTQLKQAADTSALADVFVERFTAYHPRYALQAQIEAQLYHSVEHWLGGQHAPPVASGQQTGQGVVVLDVTVPLQPLSIPLFNQVSDAYIYQQRIVLIPEKKFVSE